MTQQPHSNLTVQPTYDSQGEISHVDIQMDGETYRFSHAVRPYGQQTLIPEYRETADGEQIAISRDELPARVLEEASHFVN